MTDEEFYSLLKESVFITQDEWAAILQNEEHDILIDYEDEKLWATIH